MIGDGEGVADREVDGPRRAGAARALPLDGAAAHLRRALGRLPPPGTDRHVRDLLEPRGDAGRRGATRSSDEDWIFPRYRESAIGLLRGMPPATCCRGGAGIRPAGGTREDYSVASICVPIATHVPHAAGFAWGKKLEGERACAIAFFGDGATSEGAFHEGANFAGVMRAPLVLFCNNNQWAISTPRRGADRRGDARGQGGRLRHAGRARRRRGRARLLRGDARGGRARARAGDGPTFIEAVSYRAAPHATADDPSAYIDLERVEEEKQRECVGRFEGYLRRAGILHDDLAASVRAEASSAMRAAIAAAEAEPRGRRRRCCSRTRTSIRRRRSLGPRRAATELRRNVCRLSLMAELSIVEAINDASTSSSSGTRSRDGDGRGRRPRRRRLPRDRRPARPLRADRCVDTPLAEAGILGTAVGLCMAGWRPVCEMQYDAFSLSLRSTS